MASRIVQEPCEFALLPGLVDHEVKLARGDEGETVVSVGCLHKIVLCVCGNPLRYPRQPHSPYGIDFNHVGPFICLNDDCNSGEPCICGAPTDRSGWCTVTDCFMNDRRIANDDYHHSQDARVN